MIPVDIIISDLGDGDISIHFVTSDLYNELKWSQAEIDNENKWEGARLHRERIDAIFGIAIENNDCRIIKSIYSQAFTNGEEVNAEFKIGRIMNLED